MIQLYNDDCYEKIDKIFNKVPVPAWHIDKLVDKRWEQLFRGEL